MNLEIEYKVATMSLEGLSTLSNNSREEVSPFSPLDLDGFKMAMDMRSSLSDLPENKFQPSWHAKKKNWLWRMIAHMGRMPR